MSINIHGKEYVTVAERLQEAHKGEKLQGVTTEVLKDDPIVVIKATVNISGVLYTGISSANPLKLIEKENPYEVAETSAVGRALGFAGYGVVDAVASADEMIKSSLASSQNQPTENSVPSKAPTIADRIIAQQNHYCQVHQRDLKFREGRDGNVWDHRLQIDGVWNVCYGQKWIPQNTYKKEIPEVDINEQ